MQTFSFAPPTLGLGDNKKNYVFVDEHNRHKRLKVMRACEGCRRRKIKCDAATTNAWPCAACVRLKLHCVPPTVNYDRTHTSSSNISGLERVLDFDNSSGSGDEDYPHHTSVPQVFELDSQHGHLQSHQGSYGDGLGVFHTPPYTDRALSHPDFSPYDDVPAIPLRVPEGSYPDQNSFNTSSGPTLASSGSSPNWSDETFSAAGLSSILGELKIDESGVAPYISQQKKSLAEAPALEEFEVKLPSTSTGSGSTVRIPPELMPSEEQCMEWFDIFFKDIHPYVPVISKPYFYQQWRTNRKLISPLILEAIFACAGRMSDDPAQGAQWLALASKHEDCFMDVPRLSTIQALVLLLKARESAPKRGYYYRSWMTVKKLVTMAKDLELHEHYAEHQAGRDCRADPTECLIKTRIWQTIFICEIMVGGPQGRYDFEVDPESVDLNLIQSPLPEIDQSDYLLSRQYTHFTRMVLSVRFLNNIYSKVKKQKDWGADPQFTNLNPTVSQWLNDLPTDLQVTFPDDETPPWLPSHFVGNMHTYHHLFVIMLHRPQLMSSSSFPADGSWKKHMALSYASAKAMCRLQESIFRSFGLSGLLCMMRGINFVLYAVLTCTMIHLVAITSPDPDFNTNAKDYFTRHMRLLESCTSAWPMPEMQTQIDALREAFSADTSRPFELKPSFPYGSPGANFHPSPSLDVKYQHNNLSRQTSHEQPGQLQFHSHPLTPPIAGDHDDQDGPIAAASLTMMDNGQQPMSLASTSIETDPIAWNPTRIFDQWTTAFGTPSSMIGANNNQLPEPSPPLYTPPSIGSHDLPPLHDAMQQQQYPAQSSMPPLSRIQSVPSQPSYTSAGPLFVTSSMWRDTVANTYDPGGQKRRWDMETNFLVEPVQSKRSR